MTVDNKQKFILIAAVGKNRELGDHGDMPWKRALKEDLSFFKKQTSHHPVLMGRKTFESLPGLLPNREHILLSAGQIPAKEHVHVYSSIADFLEDPQWKNDTVYVIGGGSIYRQFLPRADCLLLTEIDSAFQADTWFPEFDPKEFVRTVLSSQQDGNYHTKHVCYKRKNS